MFIEEIRTARGSSARRGSRVLLAVVLGLVAIGNLAFDWPLIAADDPHAYFDALVRRPDHWKSFSFRDSSQLDREWVTYDPLSDRDPHRQDAAKILIPAFFDETVLTQSLSATETVITVAEAYRPKFPGGRVLKVDNEVMTTVRWVSGTTVEVKRGTHNTSAAAHASGAKLMVTSNSLKSQVRVPLLTTDGHEYFFVWDAYWTDSYVGAGRFNHKAFQFSSGGQGGDSIWLEPQVSYSPGRSDCFDAQTHVATFQVRSYNQLGGAANWSLTDGNSLGPAMTEKYPMAPNVPHCLEPNTWVRFFMRLQQRANDYDIVDLWVADENRDPVQVLKGAQVSVRPDGRYPNQIGKFWIEFNSSGDDLTRLDQRDLVAYVRNFVALQDPGSIAPLLVRPIAGVQPVENGPRPPTALRLFRR